MEIKKLLQKLKNICSPPPQFENEIRNEPSTCSRLSYNHTKSSQLITIIKPENLKLGFGSIFNDYCWVSAKFGIIIGENTFI